MAQRPPRQPQIPWPTAFQLEHAGFVRCQSEGCSVFVDPVNVPEKACREHQARKQRTKKS